MQSNDRNIGMQKALVKRPRSIIPATQDARQQNSKINEGMSSTLKWHF